MAVCVVSLRSVGIQYYRFLSGGPGAVGKNCRSKAAKLSLLKELSSLNSRFGLKARDADCNCSQAVVPSQYQQQAATTHGVWTPFIVLSKCAVP